MSFLCKDSMLLVDSRSCLSRSCFPGLFHFLSLYILMFLTMELRSEVLSHGPNKLPLLPDLGMSYLYLGYALPRFYDLDGCCNHLMSGGRCFLCRDLLLRLLTSDNRFRGGYAMGSAMQGLLNYLLHCLMFLSCRRLRSGCRLRAKL